MLAENGDSLVFMRVGARFDPAALVGHWWPFVDSNVTHMSPKSAPESRHIVGYLLGRSFFFSLG